MYGRICTIDSAELVQEPTENTGQAHLPLLLHPDPSEVLFLGLGTGITAAGAIPHAEVRHGTVVELIPEVVDAARLLEKENFGVVDHPKFNIRIDDGRHFLLTTQDRFDVMISDLFVPWESETGYLYTVEHYQTAKGRLRSGGIFCQWLALYQLGVQEFEMIADSFASVFPHTTLWWGSLDPDRPILALVGSADAIRLDGSAVNARLQAMRRTSMYVDDEIQTAEDIAFRLVGRWPARNSARLNTDEHPWIEFSAPWAHRDRRLLQGRECQRYFDRSLSQILDQEAALASGSASGWIDPERRLAWQEFILWGTSFGEDDASEVE